jgi:hypothetical protein
VRRRGRPSDVRISQVTIAAFASALMLSASCAERPPAGPGGSVDGSSEYEADTTVLESSDHGPMLCLGAIAGSYPPQCGDIPIENWDWGSVEGEESASGTTWGSFHVVGTYHGTSFTLIEAGPFQPSPREDGDPVDTPCAEPEGGWVSVDATKATEEDMLATMHAAEDEPDYAGFWIDYVEEPGEGPVAPGGIIANVAFTGDVERHTAEIRERWGGPLCVVELKWALDALERAHRELRGAVGSELGLQVLGSGISMNRNRLEMGVVVLAEEARRAVDERYGEGAVLLVPALTPVG